MVEFYLAVFLMLAAAWVLGEAAHRLRQPALVGQLLGGIIIGPAIFNVVQPTANLAVLENIGLFFIMLLTGMTVKPREITAAGTRAAVVSLVSFMIPFAAGAEIAHTFGVAAVPSLVVGLAVSITAVPVNAIILMELGILDTKLGQTVIAAGVIDDVVAFIVLAVIQEYAGGTTAGATTTSVLLGVGEVMAFLGAVFVADLLIRRNIDWLHKQAARFGPQIRAPGSAFIALVAFAVGVSLLAEHVGMQFGSGAFFAGLLMGELFGAEALGKANDVLHGVAFGFFAPMAFAYIGTEFVLPSVGGLGLLGSVLVAALATKFFGGYVGARAVKFNEGESLTIGFLMNSRGFVELVVSTTAYQLGLIDQAIFSLVVCVGIITTVISPIASRMALRRMEKEVVIPPQSQPAEEGVAAPQRQMFE